MAKVLVSGCFDLFHVGHVCFLETAASYGNLHVSVGSDATIAKLKRRPIYSEKERLYFVRSLKCVTDAFIASGDGVLDFEKEFIALKPDVFVVNGDGHHEEKRALCQKYGVQYVVLDRTPAADLPARSTTEVLSKVRIPYRIDIAGGWFDQPWVSSVFPGPVITVSIEPTYNFPERSGMATSTRNRAIKIWGNNFPAGDYEEFAKILFCYDNFPGSQYISGSQDAIGIVCPGLKKLNYRGNYWPASIDTESDPAVLEWLENNCRLIPSACKPSDLQMLTNLNLSQELLNKFSAEAEACWQAILKQDVEKFGRQVTAAFAKQMEVVPKTKEIVNNLEHYQKTYPGAKLTGSGGFIFVVSPEPIENEIRIKIR